MRYSIVSKEERVSKFHKPIRQLRMVKDDAPTQIMPRNVIYESGSPTKTPSGSYTWDNFDKFDESCSGLLKLDKAKRAPIAPRSLQPQEEITKQIRADHSESIEQMLKSEFATSDIHKHIRSMTSKWTHDILTRRAHERYASAMFIVESLRQEKLIDGRVSVSRVVQGLSEAFTLRAQGKALFAYRNGLTR
jgi:hypothetical protein